jgi:hypothetical protein
MRNATSESRQQRALWGLEEPEYLVAIIALLAVLAALIVTVWKGGDAKIFTAFAAVVGTLAGHAMGGAGKRRADRRADQALADAEPHARALRAVLTATDLKTAQSIVSAALVPADGTMVSPD